MLYEGDLNKLLDQWTDRACHNPADQGYKDGLNECIYDLRCLIDKNFADEALANEAFEQQLEEDSKIWSDYFENKYLQNGIFAY